jgi:O-antigen/teichoic acid export membrane protein
VLGKGAAKTMKGKSSGARLFYNTMLVFAGNAGARLIGLVMLPLYTRWLTAEEYGAADLVTVYAGLLTGITTVCIDSAVFVLPKDETKENQNVYFSSGLAFSLCALAAAAAAVRAVTRYCAWKDIINSFTVYAWLIYGVICAVFLQQYTQQFVRAIDKLTVYSVTGIVLAVLTALFSCVLIPYRGVTGYAAAVIAANTGAAFFSLIASGAFRYLRLSAIKKTAWLRMIRFSAPLVPNAVMAWLVNSFSRPFIEKKLGLRAVGIFGAAGKLSGIMTGLFLVFSYAWSISVLEEFKKEHYSRFYNTMFRLIITGMMFFAMLIAVCGKLIIGILAAPEFFEAWKYTGIMGLGAVFFGAANLAGSNFTAAKQTKYFFYSSIWVVAASLAGNIFFISKFGIMGGALSVLVSFAVMAVSRIAYCRKFVKLENIPAYLFMLAITALLIVNTLCMPDGAVKTSFTIILFCAFILMNYKRIMNIKKNIKQILPKPAFDKLLELRNSVCGSYYALRRQPHFKNVLKILKKKVSEKKKIRTGFFVMFDSMFPLEPLFCLMQSDEMFEPFIVVIPNISYETENMFDQMNKTYNNLSKKYSDVKRACNGKREFINFSGLCDIACFSTPYDYSTHKYYRISYLSRFNVLTLYATYGYVVSNWFAGMYKYRSFSCLWKYFPENSFVVNELKTKSNIPANALVCLGYVKMDRLAQFEIRKRNRKKIIIASHHTMIADDIQFSTFLRFSGFFLELPKKYPGIDFVFRPHPLLKIRLVSDSVWSKEQTDNYFEKLRAIPNAEYQEGGDYFDTFVNSDAMIHDCGSFMAEYLYTDNPACFLLKDDVQNRKNYNAFARECIAHHYHAYTEAGIMRFIDEVVVKGIDSMRQKRLSFADEKIRIHYPNVTGSILGYIKGELA